MDLFNNCLITINILAITNVKPCNAEILCHILKKKKITNLQLNVITLMAKKFDKIEQLIKYI
ncbi:hypothetical protein DY130_06260 [Apilactobacillus micheneri]|uniref:Uncharacterized protein n=1 Tax=Apilactobacillus micheneri TaxID=1899430 RepID=A0A9Q8INE3_9LACO|nr:hypothetical protein DY121_06265 [Apilactobacillus micheneri]TPR43085.1 hypothetical protein DY130_06260 [Apilactobacillus micheneri]TPR44065.1 hypothetical protein DY128_06265 [Apilactobacillus micheneri]